MPYDKAVLIDHRIQRARVCADGTDRCGTGKAYQAGFEKRQEGDYQDFAIFAKDEVESDLKNMIRFLDAVEALIRAK